MELFQQIAPLRERLRELRRQGKSVAFVPTMGNLHQGHLELVRQAQQVADIVVVSIYVNPTQFGEGEDFEEYPRTLERDRVKLDESGATILFAPTDAEIYPPDSHSGGAAGRSLLTQVVVPGLSDILCGASRPGHFTGVATVVTKLLNIVQPDIALFGEKDFQQLMVIRRLVEELNLPVRVVGVPTWREEDGLAMSSRNGYLTPEQRRQAPTLYHTLQWICRQLEAGSKDFSRIEAQGEERLREAGFSPDYLSVRDAATLQPAKPEVGLVVVVAAAVLGSTRLIDNCVANLR